MESRKLSSFYVELHESFLPEPLILTILMESKSLSYHLAIEKESAIANSNVKSASYQVNEVLFAGKNHKGYQWMVEFLSLMHSITLKSKLQQNPSKQLIMTQYMLKLLTILTNILISNLQLIEKETTGKFLVQIITAMKKSPDAL